MTKITVCSTKQTWYTKILKEVAEKNDVDLDVLDVKNVDDLKVAGDVIYWRSSSIENSYPTIAQRSRFLLEAKKAGKVIVNETLLTDPFLSYKSYQQSFIKNTLPKINTIPTFTAINQDDLKQLIDDGSLSFPFIAKPDHGSQGTDIILASSLDDLSELNTNKYIFQNFIKNDGDYRIYVIGGVAVEIIKRDSAEGSFLNNISQGGSAQKVEDLDKREVLATMATQIAATMNLSICGIDIMQDNETGEYYFLEVNTVAQWQGLQAVSDVGISELIINHLKNTNLPDENKISKQSVEDYYVNNLNMLSREKQFHFCSRMYLVNNKEKYNEYLKNLKSWYVWDKNELGNKLGSIIKNANADKEKVINNHEFRIKHAEKYPLLGAYNKILYKTLFTKTIYNIDYTETVADLLNKTDIAKYRNLLISDKSALFALSTHAVNFLYLTQWLFEDEIVNASNLLEITKEELLPDKKSTNLSRIYLLTHSIICASLFYSKEISKNVEVYNEILKDIEEFIFLHYTEISLDQKCEFLVCAKILKHETRLKSVIYNEIKQSASPHGNYIVDILNIHKSSTKKDLSLSEHRNVLYLLS